MFLLVGGYISLSQSLILPELIALLPNVRLTVWRSESDLAASSCVLFTLFWGGFSWYLVGPPVTSRCLCLLTGCLVLLLRKYWLEVRNHPDGSHGSLFVSDDSAIKTRPSTK